MYFNLTSIKPTHLFTFLCVGKIYVHVYMEWVGWCSLEITFLGGGEGKSHDVYETPDKDLIFP